MEKLNFLISTEDNQKLEEISEATELNKSELIRGCIRYFHKYIDQIIVKKKVIELDISDKKIEVEPIE